jgi:hypothetical protein
MRASVRQHRRALPPGAQGTNTRTFSKRAYVRQPSTPVVNPACGCSRDRNEEQDSGLRPTSVERNKEGDGFVDFRWGETKEQEADGGVRLMIETDAEFRFICTFCKRGCLPCQMAQNSAVPGALGQMGILRVSSRGDKTAIELFVAGVRGWEAGWLRRMDGRKIR